MLEYTYEQADALLRDRLSAAKVKLVRRLLKAQLRGASNSTRALVPKTRVSSALFAAPFPHFACRPPLPACAQAHTIEDLAFVRDQIITCQVSMARVYNHEVKERRAAAALEAGVTLGGGPGAAATPATAAAAAAAASASSAAAGASNAKTVST